MRGALYSGPSADLLSHESYMKKSVAVIGGVVVIGSSLWLGSTWYTGMRLEAGSSEQMTLVNEELLKNRFSLGADVKLNQDSFQRNLFDSQAHYTLLITRNDGKQLNLGFDVRYEHGPFPLSALSRGQITPTMALAHGELTRTRELEGWFNAVQNATTPLWVDAAVYYTGNTDYTAGLAAIKYDQDQASIDFSGAQLQSTYQHATKHAKGTFGATSLTATERSPSREKPFQFALTGVQMDIDVKGGQFADNLGAVELRADRLHIANAKPGSMVSIENLAYGGSASEDEQFLKGEGWLRGKALTVNNFVLGDPSLTFKLNQIDGASVKRIQAAGQALGASSTNPDAVDEKLLKQAIQAIFDGNPQFAIDPLSWKNAKGESTLNVQTTFGNPDNQNLPIALFLAQALKSVNVDLTLHEPMVVELLAQALQIGMELDADSANDVAQQQFDELADKLTQTGFVEEDGDNLVSHMKYANGDIAVNGRKVSMNELMGLFMAF